MLLTGTILYFTISTLVELCTARDPDYFEEKYDEDKNCKYKEKIVMLSKAMRKNKTICNSVGVKVKDIAPYICKANLRNMLSTFCTTRSRVKETKNFMYCYSRGSINCCFESYKCVVSHEGKDKLKTKQQELEEYLKYGLKVYPDLYAYKHEYRICKLANEPTGTDLCKKECENEENNDFAKECNKNPKANFKCCAVRTNIGCDSCGICCLIPVCTIMGLTEEMNTVKFNVNTTLTPVIDTHTKAEEIHKHQKSIRQFDEKAPSKYYNPEIHQFCLKIDENDKKKSYDEPSYNMTAYRAFAKKGKVDVPTFKLPEEGETYHPESRKKFASSKGAKYWSDTFGYDKCYKINPGSLTKSKCFPKCERMKKTKFAKKCNKKDNSVYKCCVRIIDGSQIEERQKKIMKKLHNDKFISKPLQEFCSRKKCIFCCLTSICTYRDINGVNVHDFKIKAKSILAKDSLRYRTCRAVDANFKNIYKYNMTEHKRAYTKDMLCAVPANRYKRTNKGISKKIIKNNKIMTNKYCHKKKRKAHSHSKETDEASKSSEGRRQRKKKKRKRRRSGKVRRSIKRKKKN